MDRRELARVWAEAKPSIRIGKDGIDSGVVEEVKRQLKRQRMIKVRFLRSAGSSEALETLVLELEQQTGSHVCGRRGSVIVLARKGV
jgi:RNA-binding protein